MFHLVSNAQNSPGDEREKMRKQDTSSEDLPATIIFYGLILTCLSGLHYWRNHALRRFCLKYVRNNMVSCHDWFRCLSSTHHQCSQRIRNQISPAQDKSETIEMTEFPRSENNPINKLHDIVVEDIEYENGESVKIL